MTGVRDLPSKEQMRGRASDGLFSQSKDVHNTSEYEREGKKAVYKQTFRSGYIEEQFLTDAGLPFLLAKRRYFEPIYNLTRRLLVIIASRQAEKSSFVSKSLLYELAEGRNDALMYVTASQSHLFEFVRRKIDRQFDFNKKMRSTMLGPGAINNVHDKIYLNGNVLACRAVGQSAEPARGVPARKIYFDETQSILSDNIPIVRECAQSYPDTSEYVYVGTPLTTNNHLSLLFTNSRQWEWIVLCKHCWKPNPPLGMDHIDESKPYLFCVFCGKDLVATYGKWEMQNPAGKYDGFRICRLMTPTCRWKTDAQDGILDKLKDYAGYQFKNEVLGLADDVGVVPITTEEIAACCGDFSMIDPFNPPNWIFGRRVALTIDWAWSTKEQGPSYTIIALWTRDTANKIRLLYAKRFTGHIYEDPENVLGEITKIVARCNVKMIGTDYGIGHKENRRLDTILSGVKVAEYMYAGTHERPVWNRVDKRYHIGRTQSLDRTFAMIKRLGYALPRWEEVEPYAQDVLNVYTEVDPNMKRVKYEHAGTGPDDFLHLMNYAQMLAGRGGI